MSMFIKRLANKDNWQCPTNWSVVLLEKNAKRGSGHTPNKKMAEYWNQGIKWVSLSDSYRLDNVYIHDTEKKISELGIANSSAVLHPPGIVILSRDAGVGKSAMTSTEMAVSQHFIVWKCDDKTLNNHFLYYWLQFMKPEFERIAIGSTIKTIGLPYFKKMLILRPPLPEQRKIAEILGAWDEAITLTERLIEGKQKRKKGLMQQLLTGKVRFPGFEGADEWVETKIARFPADWDLVTLGSLGTFSKGSGIKKSELVENGLPCVRYGEIYTIHHFQIKEFRSFIRSETASKSPKIYAGDLLFAGSGETLKEIGKCVAYTGDEEAYAGGDIIILRLSKGNPEFLGFLLNNDLINRQKCSLGQGNSVVHIYARHLKNILVPLPSLEEQGKIASILQACDDEIALLQRKAAALREQKKGLMQQLLMGKVRVKG